MSKVAGTAPHTVRFVVAGQHPVAGAQLIADPFESLTLKCARGVERLRRYLFPLLQTGNDGLGFLHIRRLGRVGECVKPGSVCGASC